jgi:hypothetical protein
MFVISSDRVKSGEIVLRHNPTEQMFADIFTKPLVGNLFRSIRDSSYGGNVELIIILFLLLIYLRDQQRCVGMMNIWRFKNGVE